MKKSILLFFLLFFCAVNLQAQLKPFIGLNSLPSNSAVTCKEPIFNGSFYTSGYLQGDTVADFKLYDLNGDSLILSNELASGKPVLFIGGSLTCPVFRNKVTTINQVASAYSNKIKIFVIYTIEAHPTDTSVYFGYVNVTSQNTTAGILFPNTHTYGDRKMMVDTMKTWLTLNVPVFLDGPCNNWWKKYGPAPNNSYLISPNGVVLNKQGWFDKFPDNIFCALDSILNVNSGLCVGTPTQPGNFNLNVLNSKSFGQPGAYMYDFVDIINTSTVSTTIKIKKLLNTLPASWQTALCADICYSTSEDSAIVSVAPLDTIHFSLDFITSIQPDSGSVRVGFKNMNKSNNSFSMWLSGNTLQVGVGLKENNTSNSDFSIYPNPSHGILNISTAKKEFSVTVFDPLGREVFRGANTIRINTAEWSSGIYNLILQSESEIEVFKINVFDSVFDN